MAINEAKIFSKNTGVINGFAFIISPYFLLLVNGLTLCGDEQRKTKLSLYFQKNILSLQCLPLLLTHKYFFQGLGEVLGIFTLRL